MKEAYGDDIQREFGPEVIVPTTPFPVVKLADLYDALEKEYGYTVPESEKGDLTTEAERLSYDWVKKHTTTSSSSSPITAPRSVPSITCGTKTVCPWATT